MTQFAEYLDTLGPDGHTKTLGYIPPGAGHRIACPRLPVERVRRIVKLPVEFIEALEQNQKLASCCRHPENHEIAAWYSSPEDAAKGIPDIYKFHCTCGRVHARFCVGGSRDPKTGEITHPRPFWEIR
jgi:hypothetical protein